MKLLIIRHGDPDYVHDSLTEKGEREAALLAERIAPMDIAGYYVSPLGRAQATAARPAWRAGRACCVARRCAGASQANANLSCDGSGPDGPLPGGGARQGRA